MNKLNKIMVSGISSLTGVLALAAPALAQVDYTYSTTGTTDPADGVFAAVGFFVWCAICVVSLGFTIGTAWWVHRDAKSRGNENALLWAIGSALLAWPIVLIIYIVTQRKDTSSTTPKTETVE